jgi:hypothetical protein
MQTNAILKIDILYTIKSQSSGNFVSLHCIINRVLSTAIIMNGIKPISNTRMLHRARLSFVFTFEQKSKHIKR